MNRAESPYDRIVDIPTRASEKDMNSGERVVLCSLVSNQVRVCIMKKGGGRGPRGCMVLRGCGEQIWGIGVMVTHVHPFQFSTGSNV
jgi:hypothetical protein